MNDDDFSFFSWAGLNVIHGFSEMVLKGHFVNLWNWHWVDPGRGSWSSSTWSRLTASTWATTAPHHARHRPRASAHACHGPSARGLIGPGASTQCPLYLPLIDLSILHQLYYGLLLHRLHHGGLYWPVVGIFSLCVGLALSPTWLFFWFCLWAMVEGNGQIKYFNIFSLNIMDQKKKAELD